MSTVRNHPLEGDGCRTGFFQHLLRSNGVASTVDVEIPDTIVFEHNCPRSWFYYDTEINEVRRRIGKDLQAGSILQEFTAKPVTVGSRTLDVVATYTFLTEGAHDSDDPVVTVQYLSAADLSKFIVTSSPEKREGILQKYTLPVESNECLLQAVWSPRICVLRRRANRRALQDVPRVLEERHVTFDGPEHFSNEVACSKDTVRDATVICEDIAEHLYRTLHLKVSGMILFFKLTPAARLRLLWCSSIRFHGPRVSSIRNPMFVCPPLENDGDAQMMKELGALAVQDARLNRDLHSRTGVATPTKRKSSTGGGSVAAGSFSAGQLLTEEAAMQRVAALGDSWFEINDEVQEEYDAICEDERASLAVVEDTLYGALCHFQQQHASSEYKFRFPLELSRNLGGDEKLDAFVRHLGLERLATDDLVVRGVSGGGVAPNSNDQPLSVPIPALMNLASGWIRSHFRSRKRLLLSRALPQLQLHTLKLLNVS